MRVRRADFTFAVYEEIKERNKETLDFGRPYQKSNLR